MKEHSPQQETRVIDGKEYTVIDLDEGRTTADMAEEIHEREAEERRKRQDEYEERKEKTMRQFARDIELGKTTIYANRYLNGDVVAKDKRSYRRHAMSDLMYDGIHNANDHTHEG